MICQFILKLVNLQWPDIRENQGNFDPCRYGSNDLWGTQWPDIRENQSNFDHCRNGSNDLCGTQNDLPIHINFQENQGNFDPYKNGSNELWGMQNDLPIHIKLRFIQTRRLFKKKMETLIFPNNIENCMVLRIFLHKLSGSGHMYCTNTPQLRVI